MRSKGEHKMMKRFAIALIVALMSVSLFAVPAMAATNTVQNAAVSTNTYVGAWTLDEFCGQITMEVFNDGTAYYVDSNEPNVGYYYSYFIHTDGSLCVYEGNQMVGAYAVLSQNQLIDYDGNTWSRIR